MAMPEEKDAESKGEALTQLTELDLHCTARHIREYVERFMKGSTEAPNACDGCSYLFKCTGVDGALDPWPSFWKLSDLTGVVISPFRGA